MFCQWRFEHCLYELDRPWQMRLAPRQQARLVDDVKLPRFRSESDNATRKIDAAAAIALSFDPLLRPPLQLGTVGDQSSIELQATRQKSSYRSVMFDIMHVIRS